MITILIVEDDLAIAKLLASDLKLEGYSVSAAKDGVEGLEMAQKMKPDLILLDINLPKMTGYDVCRLLRKEGSDIPIIMLTARGQETEKVVGLDYGADDYLAKPYSSMELMARVRALLRRRKRQKDGSEQTTFGDIVVDFSRMSASKNGVALSLTTKEFQMLELLVQNRGRVVSRNQFLQDIWGYEEMPSTRTVDNRVMKLRQKLSPDNPGAYIVSVHGTGYKFIG